MECEVVGSNPPLTLTLTFNLTLTLIPTLTLTLTTLTLTALTLKQMHLLCVDALWVGLWNTSA